MSDRYKGSKKLYSCCSRLFRELYKSNSLFRHFIDEDDYINVFKKDDNYYIGSVEIDTNVQNYFKDIDGCGTVTSVLLSSVYKYPIKEGFLYSRGLDLYKSYVNGTEIVTLDAINKVYEYPSKEEILKDTLKLELNDDVLFELLKALNIEEEYIIGKVFMDDDLLCVGFYNPLLPSKVYKYGYSKGLDTLLESLIKRLDKYNISICDIYWFIQGSYNCVKVKEAVNNEYKMIIS